MTAYDAAVRAEVQALRAAGTPAAAKARVLACFAAGAWDTPDDAWALGCALFELGAPDEAIACFRRVVKAHPRNPHVLALLAGALCNGGDPAAGWRVLERPLRTLPPSAPVLLSAARIRHLLGDFEGAQRLVRRADLLIPGHQAVRLQRAFTTLLTTGDRSGWVDLEARALPDPGTGARPWQGEPLAGGSVLVSAEQGVGDLMQFARYLPGLSARGAGMVMVQAPPEVAPVFEASGFLVTPPGMVPVTTWHVPIMSLPLRLGVAPDPWGEVVPYLRAPAVAAPLPLPPRRAGVRRLGLVWACNPVHPERRFRDLDPACLPMLADVPGIEWVVLQHGEAAREAPPTMCTPALSASWGDTAAWLQQLDGLVSVDTGIVHLSGALGVPTWVLLSSVADWRWGRDEARSAWYPTVTLVRQPRWGDWPGAVAALRVALADDARTDAPHPIAQADPLVLAEA
ncbi:MAG: hypothetical protein KJT01_07350 [Gemmatimonadetes bacterium]|nr:hypothetical protein [Gemmatimonadota bacterium]